MILVDTSIFIHANYHVISKYSDTVCHIKLADRTVNQISSLLVKNFPGQNAILTLDGSTTLFRRKIYPEYKANRGEPKFDKDKVNTIISNYFQTVAFPTLESDDLLYLLSCVCDNPIIVTTDSDMHLMLDKNTSIYNHRLDKIITLTDEEVAMKILNKIIYGDETDNIRGIKLKKLYQNYLLSVYREFEKIIPTLNHIQQAGYISDWKLNYDLVNYSVYTYQKYLTCDVFESLVNKLIGLCQG